MRIAIAALALLSLLPTPAFADAAHDRSAAIQVCRAEVAARTGVEADTVRLNNVRPHGRSFRVDLSVWTNSAITNVRCEASVNAGTAEVASIDPPLTAASASR
ncbi:MAG: hypothetical protein ABUS48_06260 [Pseudomonadota bacterium]